MATRSVERVRYPETFRTLDGAVDLRSYPTIAGAWDHTRRRLGTLSASMNVALCNLPRRETLTVAVAGSYGRMEATAHSDFDYMVLAVEPVQSDVKQDLLERIKRVAADNDIPLPNPEGVFAQVAQYEDLISRAGSREDTLDCLAQRMLLLMEARPVYNETVFRNALDRILQKYLAYLIDDPAKESLFLLNDLIRYFRSICVNYEFNFWRQEEKWVLRNMKLRHSRVVMYAGLLLTLMNASIQKNKLSYIRDMLSLSPLERIATVYREAGDRGIDRVLGIYDVFLHRVQDPTVRQSLQVEYEHRHSLPAYREMKVTADALSAELTRFIFAQRGRWTEAVFEYVLF